MKDKESKKELKLLTVFLKKLKEKKGLKNLRHIKDSDEKIEAAKYLIKTKLTLKYDHLRKETEKMKEKNKDVFFAETKLSLVKSKTRLFLATHSNDDFNNLMKVLKEAEKEIGNV